MTPCRSPGPSLGPSRAAHKEAYIVRAEAQPQAKA